MRHCRSSCGLRRFVCPFLRPIWFLKKNCAPPEAKKAGTQMNLEQDKNGAPLSYAVPEKEI
jgi:hypothetical protein